MANFDIKYFFDLPQTLRSHAQSDITATDTMSHTCNDTKFFSFSGMTAGPNSRPYSILPQRTYYPRRPYCPDEPMTYDRISFHDLSIDSGLGVPINQPCGGHSPILTINGGSDLVFQDYPDMRKISLHIMWPGYESLLGGREAEHFTVDPATLTRAMLAQVVANRVKLFMERAAQVPSRHPNHIIGNGGIEIGQVYLHGLRNTYSTAWQADLSIEG
ncbi:hypothetical protein HYPSUDRAFT_209253 [Hypholoma sublateritium FD-334 SS-4]|uniref:Uncharacterized protein n=1 Tax=Hypholoma sublateritium (strain FD-334 SS-4) TaxID=945553 RepID=A0A0D2N3G0_HYPSF|nr:hypothetical protein HYPSUDRAFT_209253 [Hypholoma sublateritium FD-334 SS-4]